MYCNATTVDIENYWNNSDKVTEATDAVLSAWDAVNEVARPLAIMVDSEKAQVQLGKMEDLDKIPGEIKLQIYSNIRHCIHLSKTCHKVEFMVALTVKEFQNYMDKKAV